MSVFSDLLSAELAVFLPSLDNMLTALQQPGVNVQSVVQDAGKEQLAALGSVPQAESVAVNALAAAAQAQLHNIVKGTTPEAPVLPPAA